MATASLNFDENQLDKESSLYDLYKRLYEGMRQANMVDSPDFYTNPPLTGSGEVDDVAINQQIADYSNILMKNSAYLMASSINATVGSGGSGGGSVQGALLRAGDTMEGKLGALYGFEAGIDGRRLLEAVLRQDDRAFVRISNDLDVLGKLNLSSSGIYMSETNVMYYVENVLHIDFENIALTGNISVNGQFTLGDVLINEYGIFFRDVEFYHSGNSNNENVSWTMKNSNVFGELDVRGKSFFGGFLEAKNGFTLGANSSTMLTAMEREDSYDLRLLANLDIAYGFGISFDGRKIVHVRDGTENIVSFSAPGMVMNLGDSDGELTTEKISLQTGIYNYNNAYKIISQYGDGNFPNSFSAGCGNSGPTVIQSYYKSSNDCGVVFQQRIRLGKVSGPSLYSKDGEMVVLGMPFAPPGLSSRELEAFIYYGQTTSLFRNQSLDYSASLFFDTVAEFIVYNKPVEADSFTIKSEQYKTRLAENVLFFGDGKFIEGVVDGMFYNGNAYFANSLGSQRFASGFAGYGWNIGLNELYGGVAATFDELTIRRKMRVYELEVQKSSVTNGSLWVSDSCSGDLVEEIA